MKGIIWKKWLVKLGDSVKNIRQISDNEREILLKSRLRGALSLGIMFYAMGVLLPFFVCMLITWDFTYLYLFISGLIILLFITVLYPLIYYNHIQTGKIECFDSVVLSCKKGDIYFCLVEIEGFDGNFISHYYPVSKSVKTGTEVSVIMLFGKNKVSKYLLIDKDKKEFLSSKRTRFDLV